MAVTARQTPDFRTGSDFRQRPLRALGERFPPVLPLCQKAGVVALGHVALDGTTLTAQASKPQAMRSGRLQKTEAELAATVPGGGWSRRRRMPPERMRRGARAVAGMHCPRGWPTHSSAWRRFGTRRGPWKRRRVRSPRPRARVGRPTPSRRAPAHTPARHPPG